MLDLIMFLNPSQSSPQTQSQPNKPTFHQIQLQSLIHKNGKPVSDSSGRKRIRK